MVKDLNQTISPDKEALHRKKQQEMMRKLKSEAAQLRRDAADLVRKAAQKILDQAEVRGNLAVELQRLRWMISGR